jgi:hypothetical protein
MSTVTLRMAFKTEDDKSKVVSISPARKDLEVQEVKDSMDAMIASGLFVFNPTDKIGAEIVERDVNGLF